MKESHRSKQTFCHLYKIQKHKINISLTDTYVCCKTIIGK